MKNQQTMEKEKRIVKFTNRKEFIGAVKRVMNDMKENGIVVGQQDIPYATLEFCTFQTPTSTVEYRLEEEKQILG